MDKIITDQELDYIYKELRRIHKLLDKTIVKYNRKGFWGLFRKKEDLIDKNSITSGFFNITYNTEKKEIVIEEKGEAEIWYYYKDYKKILKNSDLKYVPFEKVFSFDKAFSSDFGYISNENNEEARLLGINLNHLDTSGMSKEDLKNEIFERIQSSYQEYFENACCNYAIEKGHLEDMKMVMTDGTVDEKRTIDEFSQKMDSMLSYGKRIKKCLELCPYYIFAERSFKPGYEIDPLPRDITEFFIPDEDLYKKKDVFVKKIQQAKKISDICKDYRNKFEHESLYLEEKTKQLLSIKDFWFQRHITNNFSEDFIIEKIKKCNEKLNELNKKHNAVKHAISKLSVSSNLDEIQNVKTYLAKINVKKILDFNTIERSSFEETLKEHDITFEEWDKYLNSYEEKIQDYYDNEENFSKMSM